MLGIDRQAARYTWTAAAILLLLATVYLIRTTLFVFIVALLFAYLLTPLVNFLDRVLPASRTRTPALIVAYLMVTGVLIFAGFELGSRIVDQADSLIGRLNLLGKAVEPAPIVGEPTVVDRILGGIQSQIRQHSADIVSFLPRAGLKALSIAGDLVWVVIVPILSFFFLKDGRVMREKILGLMDEGPRRDLVEDVVKDMNVLLAQYMRALLVLSVFTLVFFSFYLSVTRVPYALLLAAIAAILEFIPMIGPFTAADHCRSETEHGDDHELGENQRDKHLDRADSPHAPGRPHHRGERQRQHQHDDVDGRGADQQLEPQHQRPGNRQQADHEHDER